MANIPKREGQGINGWGVSIAALVALLVLLPVMSASVITIGKRFGGGEDNTFAGPALHHNQHPTMFPTYMDVSYDLNSPLAGPGADYASGNGHGALEDNGISTGAGLLSFATETYRALGSCLNATRPSGTDCGDDDFRVAVADFPGDVDNSAYSLGSSYSYLPLDEVPWRIEFEAIDPNTIYACDDTRWGRASFDYKIHLHTYGLVGPEDWLDLLGSGEMHYNNYQETNLTSGGITNPCYARLFLAHDLDVDALNVIATRTEWARTNAPPGSGSGTVGGFFVPSVANDWTVIISFDNLTDRDRGIPTSLSSQPNVFEASGDGNELYARLKFHLVGIDGINSASRLATIGVGGIFWLAAVASTPAWNPLKDRMKKGVAQSGRRGVD